MGNDVLTVGTAIRAARKSRKLSAADLGSMLTPRVSHTAVYKWENGLTEPNLSHLKQISELLGIDVAGILGTDAEGPHDEMRRYFELMNDNQRSAVLGVARAMVDC